MSSGRGVGSGAALQGRSLRGQAASEVTKALVARGAVPSPSWLHRLPPWAPVPSREASKSRSGPQHSCRRVLCFRGFESMCLLVSSQGPWVGGGSGGGFVLPSVDGVSS